MFTVFSQFSLLLVSDCQYQETMGRFWRAAISTYRSVLTSDFIVDLMCNCDDVLYDAIIKGKSLCLARLALSM